jgi:hypothetical protein
VEGPERPEGARHMLARTRARPDDPQAEARHATA